MIHFKKELITPNKALSILQSNTKNRRLKSPHVNLYARDMQSGRWKEDTAEMIKISDEGLVLDGQHRLNAVIESNTAVWFHVAYDVPTEVFDVLDTGSTRSASDAFKIKGVKHESSIPSIITTYNLLCSNKRRGIQVHHKATNSMLLDQYLQNENFWQEIAKSSHARYLSFAKILPPSYIGGFAAFFIGLNEVKANDFMDQLCSGVGITNNAINILRTKLIQDKLSPRKMNHSFKFALIIKAWNAFVQNKQIKVLKYDIQRDEYPSAVVN